MAASVAALALGVAAVVIAALLLAPLARADGDPASDWLLARPAFFPPDAGISSTDQKALTQLLLSAKAHGYTVRVAIVSSQYDMGAITVLWKRPADYAPFLSQELRFLYKQRVLVVMPNGFAIARNGKHDPSEQAIVAKLVVAKPFQGAPLAAATETAVRKLAASAGIVLPRTAIGTSSGGSSTTRDRILIGVAGLVVLLGVSYWRLRGRFARGRDR